MAKPDYKKVPLYFHHYINLVDENDLLTALEKQAQSFFKLLKKIPDDKTNYRYAKGKWSIKEMLQHIIDSERIFAYRALCISRKDLTPLPGYDENLYASNSKADKRNWKEMLKEFQSVRDSTIILFKSFDKNQLNSSGVSNDNPIYVLGIGFIIAGHINHHIKVLKDRYLK